MTAGEKQVIIPLAIAFVASAAAGLIEIRSHHTRLSEIESKLKDRQQMLVEHIQLMERVKNLEAFCYKLKGKDERETLYYKIRAEKCIP